MLYVHIQMFEQYSNLQYVPTWMNFENIMLGEMSGTER